jgi:hypothetical protein
MKQNVISLWAGPGAGKSTGAAYIFSRLKMAGINAELVTEYAKDRVWQNDLEVFQNQFYVTAKQSMRMSRLKGKVDVIVTDSPVLQGAIYARDVIYIEPYTKVLREIHREYQNFDVFLNRVKPYNPKGRFQDELGAKKIDEEIRDFMGLWLPEVFIYEGSQAGYDGIIDQWLARWRTMNEAGV